jgi:hypothetical protein
VEVDVIEMAKSLAMARWVASAVAVLMIVLYLQRAECAGPDANAAYIAVAWGVILGVTLSSAVNKTRQGLRLRRQAGTRPGSGRED